MTPVMEQYHRIKSRYPDKILFFRLGDFYEMFGEDAEVASGILNIALTSRAHGKGAERIPLAGVPYHSAEKYIDTLLKAGKKVVICDQVEDSKYAKGLVKREVVEIVTPGTSLVHDDDSPPGMLLSLHRSGDSIGMAAVDFTSGSFAVDEGPALEIIEKIRILKPSEILINEDRADTIDSLKGEIECVTAVEPFRFGSEYARRTLQDHFGVHSLDGFGLEGMRAGICAAGAALSYLKETKQDRIKHLSPPNRSLVTGEMFLDSATIRNLELIDTAIPGRGKSIFQIIDYTLTAMGRRLLKNYLIKPLTDTAAIAERQKYALAFYDDAGLIERIGGLLRQLPDLERLTARLGSNRISPRDLGALLQAVITCNKLKHFETDNREIKQLLDCIQSLDEIIDLLQPALNDDLPNSDNDGGIIRPGYNPDLDNLKNSIGASKTWIAGLQKTERERTGISNLKVGFNKVFGYYIEVSSSHLKNVPDDYIRKQTLVGGERFVTEELKVRESEVLNAEEKINDLEKEIFSALVEKTGDHISAVKAASDVVSRLDVFRSFALLAKKRNYILPEINDGDRIEIGDGRHPVIEQTLPDGRFVPNDTVIGGDDGFLHIITGPNMAGKSTYLRQVGHIVILAQIGCFVPASSARLGIVDRVFTRVGASDLLPEGKSTFLVEMNEVANILNNATGRSLVLLDEVGRGTSTYDGLSVAWAVSEYIHESEDLKCKTLFATHYHELTDLASRLPGVRNYQVAVREWEDDIVFLHRIIPGGCDDSYGIQVAGLAGIPDHVIQRARQILGQLEQGDMFSARSMLDKPPKWMKKYASAQMNLFGPDSNDLLMRLKNTDISAITPLEAMRILSELVDLIKRK